MTLVVDRPAVTDEPEFAALNLPTSAPEPEMEAEAEAPAKDLLIIDYSGDLEKVWATMILASTAGAMGVKCRVFVTFWGLQAFVKDQRRVTGGARQAVGADQGCPTDVGRDAADCRLDVCESDRHADRIEGRPAVREERLRHRVP